MNTQSVRVMSRRGLINASVLLTLLVLLVFPAGVFSTPDARQSAQAASDGAASASAQQPPAKIIFTVVNQNKLFVNTLKREDIRVLEDGIAQNVVSLDLQTEPPLLLALLIDTSASQQRILPRAKKAATAFVNGMMRSGKDRAAVLSFSGEATPERDLSGDVEQVRRAIANVAFTPSPGYFGGGIVIGNPPSKNLPLAGSTAIWDALWLTCGQVLTRARGTGRRAVILITDGVDTSSNMKSQEAVEGAIGSDVVVYAIGIGDDKNFDGVEKGDLRKVAERTGGRAFFPKKVGGLLEAFEQIRQELLTQYVVSYIPMNASRDGSFHKTRIQFVNPELHKQNLQLAYPQGRFAGNVSTAQPRKSGTQ